MEHYGGPQSAEWRPSRSGAEQRVLWIVPGAQQNNPQGFTQMGHAEWSRDGQSIVFSANGPGQTTFGIWSMASDGSGWMIVGDGSVDGNFGVARWVTNSRLVMSHGGPNGVGLITIDLADTPTTADLLPATAAGGQYRDPAPYRGFMPT